MTNEKNDKPHLTYRKSLGKKFKDMTKEEHNVYSRLYYACNKEAYSRNHKARYERDNNTLSVQSSTPVVIPDGPLEKEYHRYPEGMTASERRKMYHKRKRKCVYHRLKKWFRSARERSGHTKDDSFEELVGLQSEVELREYIESQFTEGMCWSKWGVGKGRTVWHIDHIVAIKDGGSHHYTNLQPLWHIDNLRK